eukprot:6397218-Heterocapsa_arctica.AAC.1
MSSREGNHTWRPRWVDLLSVHCWVVQAQAPGHGAHTDIHVRTCAPHSLRSIHKTYRNSAHLELQATG